MRSNRIDLIHRKPLQPEVLQHAHGSEEDDVAGRAEEVSLLTGFAPIFNINSSAFPTIRQTIGHLSVLTNLNSRNLFKFEFAA